MDSKDSKATVSREEIILFDATKGTIYVAFDIEKAELTAAYPVIAVGYVAGDKWGNVYSRGRQCMQAKWPQHPFGNPLIDYGDFSKRCWEEFWLGMPGALIEMFKREAKPKEEAWKAVYDWFVDLEKRFHDIVLVSDNPAFDIAVVQDALSPFYMDLGKEFVPLRNSVVNPKVYRDVYCVDTLMMQFEKPFRDNIKDEIKAIVAHDHDPMHDAENIYRTYLRASGFAQNVIATWFEPESID